ncbi:alkyl hydroperoxide reductase thiol specific antioxidant mal allergen, partial [Fusarium albosuccineum]
MSDHATSVTTNPPKHPLPDDDGLAAVESDVLAPASESSEDDGERLHSDYEPVKEKLLSDLHRLLQEVTNDAGGSKQLGKKLRKWKDLRDSDHLKDLVNIPLEGSKTTPLHIATERGFFEMARQLLEAGANVNTQDNAWRQPLHMACKAGNDDLVRLLLEAEDYIPAYDMEGRCPIHVACSGESPVKPDTLRLLVHSNRSCINEL